jgi:hypothetical protein
MMQIGIKQARQQLPDLIDRVEAGEESGYIDTSVLGVYYCPELGLGAIAVLFGQQFRASMTMPRRQIPACGSVWYHI